MDMCGIFFCDVLVTNYARSAISRGNFMLHSYLIFAICREFSRKLAWNGYLPWKFTANE